MKKLIFLSLMCVLLFGCKDKSTGPEQTSTPISARDSIAGVASLAASHGIGMTIMRVTGDNLNPDGTTEKWVYQFMSVVSSSMSTYWFHATSAGAVYDSTAVSPLGISIITGNWIDSRIALDTAEQRGGLAFRTGNQHIAIRADLDEPLVPQAVPMWTIVYYPTDGVGSSLGVEINARTGEYIVSYRATQ